MAVQEIGPKDFEVVLRFGGGLNTRASDMDIDEREAADGENFDLDLENNEYRNRKPFDLAGTAPNAGSIDGFAQLKKRDGSLTTLIQAGTNVYSWDGAGTFVLQGTVAAGTKMRGQLTANWELDEVALIADLALQQPVMQWDGTTLANMTHNLTGDFKARYIFVDRERAHYSNVESNSVVTPHMIVGSKVSDYNNLSTSDKPSTAIGVDDPWFLLTPDLRYINGIVGAFGIIAVSSKSGSTFQITGDNSQDFAITSLFANSGADGDEPMSYIGNDIAFGRQGRIETLSGTLSFGDVETDDVSRKISDEITSFKGWTVVFNARTQRVYFFADGQSDLWVLHKPLLDEVRRVRQTSLASAGMPELSPWAKWTTVHSVDFRPTAVMTMNNPVDGLETVFMGNESGEIFRLEGSGAGDDGQDVTTSRTSKLFSVPLDANSFDMEGYIEYRKGDAATVTITIQWAGSSTTSQVLTVSLDAITDVTHFSSGTYFGGGTYFGSATRGRFVRKILAPAGQANTFQVEVEVTGQTDVNISEVGLRFQATSP